MDRVLSDTVINLNLLELSLALLRPIVIDTLKVGGTQPLYLLCVVLCWKCIDDSYMEQKRKIG